MDDLITTTANGNGQLIKQQPQNLISVQERRADVEQQGKMAMAKRFPRDTFAAHARILKECESLSVASTSLYAYPRGGERVEGPSIRLAEMIARNWGNMDCGTEEISQSGGVSQMRAYAIDLETNFCDAKTFTVRHERKARGTVKRMDDPRDVYEHTANLATRRKRACMLSIIPSWIIEDAVAKCKATIKRGISDNLDEKIRQMITMFGKFGIQKEQIEKHLGYPVENINADSFIELRNIYISIKDGIAKREDFFEFKKEDDTDQKVLAAAANNKGKKK